MKKFEELEDIQNQQSTETDQLSEAQLEDLYKRTHPHESRPFHELRLN